MTEICAVADQLDHLADLLRRAGELLDLRAGAIGLLHRAAGIAAAARHLLADLGDRGGELLGGGRQRRMQARLPAPVCRFQLMPSKGAHG
ncbi:MAG TPA: hypothetical protein VMC10_24275 [Stellaceae bacterium]|nr:hypothetical protein [Stellaceae bacterium]